MSNPELVKAQLIELLQAAKSPEAAKAAIATLFPSAKELLKEDFIDTGETDKAVSMRRLRNREFARQYFLLTPKTVVWSKSQAQELMKGDPQLAFSVFRSRIEAASVEDKPKLRRIILELLQKALTDEAASRSNWLKSLLDNAEVLFAHGERRQLGLFEPSDEDQVRIMLRQVLSSLDQPDRVALLRDAISEASDISLLCDLMRSISGDTERGGVEYKPDSLGEATTDLRSLLLDRIRKLADDGGLVRQIRPSNLLWFWWGSGEGEQVKAYTERLLDDEEGVRMLLEIPINLVRSSAGNYERVHRSAWEKIVDLQKLETLARAWVDAAEPRQSRLAERFLDALKRDGEL